MTLLGVNVAEKVAQVGPETCDEVLVIAVENALPHNSRCLMREAVEHRILCACAKKGSVQDRIVDLWVCQQDRSQLVHHVECVSASVELLPPPLR